MYRQGFELFQVFADDMNPPVSVDGSQPTTAQRGTLGSQTAPLGHVTGFEYPALSVPLEHLIKTQCLPPLCQQNVPG